VTTKQRNVPKSLKAQLIKEAGDKCANPGCSNWRVHLHHIKHWAVYKTHDGKHMIAICPSCHDTVHTSGIDDETLYRWKSIPRGPANEIRDHLYVELSPEIRCLTGSMCVLADSTNALVFTLSNSNHFGFRVEDGDIFLSYCSLRDLSGCYLVKAKSNHFRLLNSDRVRVERRTGKIRMAVLDADRYLPSWIGVMWRAVPDFVRNNEVDVLDIEVIRPGVVRLKGVFVAPDAVLAITEKKLWILRPEINGPVAFVGEGEGTQIKVNGPVTRAAFQL
jgi:hypothetical protein